jgi:tetratricopeptide (TPR) repeat protein
MLATIREYGREKLADEGDMADLRRRHAEAFVALAETAEPELTGPRAARWLDHLELDHDNVRAALEWSLEHGEAVIAFRLLAAIWRFWQVRGHIHEARRWADRVLTMPGVDGLPAETRASGFGGAGSIGYWQGDYAMSHVNYVRALEAARESGHRRAIARALYDLAFSPLPAVPADADEILRHSRPWLDQSLAIYEELGDTKGIADVNWALSIHAASKRQFEAAETYAAKGMELSRQVNDPFGVAWGAHMLGGLLVYRGQVEEAEPVFREGLELFQQSRDLGGILLLLADYSAIAEGRGDWQRQWRLSGAVTKIARETGIGVLDIGFESMGWHLPEKPGTGPEAAEWEAGERLSIEDAVALALATPAAGVPAAS